MNPNNPITSFDYFVGKVCTVHTRPTNWKLSYEQTIDYFVGVVNSVNECGICLTNPVNHKKTFIMMPSVIAIAEETVIDPANPEDAKVIEEYENKKKEMFKYDSNIKKQSEPKSYAQSPKEQPVQQVNGNPYVDLKTISKFAQVAKDKFKKGV